MGIFRRFTSRPARRRTVQPTGRAAIYSYRSSRSQPTTSDESRTLLRETSPNTRRGNFLVRQTLPRLFGLLLFVLVGGFILYQLLILSDNPQVISTTTNAVFLRPLSTYRGAAHKLLSGSLLDSNKLTINTDSISNVLKHEYPELAIVSVKLPLIGHTPTVIIEPVKAALLLTTSSGHAYVIDTNGLVLSNGNSTTFNHLPLIAVREESATVLHIGQAALSSDDVSFIQTALYQLGQKQIDVSGFVLPAGESELDMYLSKQTYHVKFNLADNDVLQQIGTFLAVRQSLTEQGITPSQYIDVRVQGRAYYL